MFATDKLQTLPPWVLKNLAALEDAVAGVTKAQKDKMNKNNSTAFNKVKSKLKKYLTEGGDVDFHFSEQLIKYRENPIASDDDSDKKKMTVMIMTLPTMIAVMTIQTLEALLPRRSPRKRKKRRR